MQFYNVSFRRRCAVHDRSDHGQPKDDACTTLRTPAQLECSVFQVELSVNRNAEPEECEISCTALLEIVTYFLSGKSETNCKMIISQLSNLKHGIPSAMISTTLRLSFFAYLHYLKTNISHSLSRAQGILLVNQPNVNHRISST